MSGSSKKDDANQPKLDELIPIVRAAETSGLSKSHLALLCRTKKIWAVKMGRDWWTTQAAVNEYLARDRKPGPKPKEDSGEQM